MAAYVASQTCEHGGCPAPAGRDITIYGQDFSFCAHHARELESQLGARLAAAGRGDSTGVAVVDGSISEYGRDAVYA